MALAADASPPRRTLRPRNRRGEGGHLRADILAAATDLLDHGDERSVTLRAVARKAGIAAPSIYPHFPGRPALMLAVVRAAFAELTGGLRAAVEAGGCDGDGYGYGHGYGSGDDGAADNESPVGDRLPGDHAQQRLYAACHAYLDFAAAHPERYRAMFGELANPAVIGGGAAGPDPASLGTEALRVLSAALADCVTAGYSTSTDPCADAVALWLGLHGLAHQRTVSRVFPWPADLVRPFVASLARLGAG